MKWLQETCQCRTDTNVHFIMQSEISKSLNTCRTSTPSRHLLPETNCVNYILIAYNTYVQIAARTWIGRIRTASRVFLAPCAPPDAPWRWASPLPSSVKKRLVDIGLHFRTPCDDRLLHLASDGDMLRMVGHLRSHLCLA